MIVDHFNTVLSGGAAVAARRLHHGLLQKSVQSRFWYARHKGKPIADPTYNTIQWEPHLAGRLGNLTDRMLSLLRRIPLKIELKKALRGRSHDFELFTSPSVATTTRLDLTTMSNDIIHLHWIAKMIDWQSFFTSIPNDFPIVWTLHDMNPFTGGCHHSDQCNLYRTGCQNCPQLAQSGPHDFSHRSFQLKQTVLHEKQLHVITPSRWLEEHVRNSFLLQDASSIQTIHNGLDLQVFRPHDQQAARGKLNLPPDQTVVGFGAASLKNRRKGFAQLLAAFSQLKNHREILGFGFGGKKLDKTNLPLPKLTTVGYQGEPDRLALAYSAMDLFVLPSWAENMPQTAIEAMACGTPVVAFDVGGISEVVQPLKTGLLAPSKNSQALAHQIQWLIDHPNTRKKMGHQSRALIEQEFDIQQQTLKHLDLYHSITQRNSFPRAA